MVLGLCVLWVTVRAVMHRTLPVAMPHVTVISEGVDLQQESSTAGTVSAAMSHGKLQTQRAPGGRNVVSTAAAFPSMTGTSRRHGAVQRLSATAIDAPSCTSVNSAVQLNAATVEQLDELPGVGPVLAQRIIQWRTSHHGFSDVHELQEVPGIGPSKFARMRSQVSVS